MGKSLYKARITKPANRQRGVLLCKHVFGTNFEDLTRVRVRGKMLNAKYYQIVLWQVVQDSRFVHYRSNVRRAHTLDTCTCLCMCVCGASIAIAKGLHMSLLCPSTSIDSEHELISKTQTAHPDHSADHPANGAGLAATSPC